MVGEGSFGTRVTVGLGWAGGGGDGERPGLRPSASWPEALIQAGAGPTCEALASRNRAPALTAPPTRLLLASLQAGRAEQQGWRLAVQSSLHRAVFPACRPCSRAVHAT